MPERVIPPACVAAVRNTVDECIPDMDWPLAHEEAEKVARAVLDAFVAGEGTGPWEVVDMPATPGLYIVTNWQGRSYVFESREESRAVAAVLNYLEAKGE